jgi:hypothetical protein
MQEVEARFGLAVPGRPIGPWSRRTGAPEASATGRALGPCWVRGAPGPQGHERSPTVTSGEEKQQVGRPPAQAARTTPASGSDCGPEGRGSTLSVICWQQALRAGVHKPFVLVELRGFEPLTSAMRTQPGRLVPPLPFPLLTRSVQARNVAGRGVVMLREAARGVVADGLLTARASRRLPVCFG